MRSLRLSVIAALAVSAACGGNHPTTTPSSTWTAPAILTHVPADSPYLVASLEPISDQLRARMLHGFEKRIVQLRKTLEDLRGKPELAPWVRAGLALLDEVKGTDATTVWRSLGLDPKGRFALYGLSIWPVVRLEIADPARLRKVIEHVTSAAGAAPKQATLDGHPYWSVPLKEVTLVAAVTEHEAVVALLPSRAVEASLPLVIGTKLPAQPLASTTKVPELLGRHRLLGYMLAYLDTHNALDILTATAQNELDAPLHALTGPISAACRADGERLAAIAPRWVFGYRQFDETGFDAVGVIETPASVNTALAKLHAAVPGVSARPAGQPLLSLGTAFRPDDLVAWLRGVAKQLHDQPFACPQLAELNRAGDELAGKLATPLPPVMRGVQGFSLVIDDATIMPPEVAGHLLISGDLVADFLSTVAAAVPAIAGIPVARDGKPVALPLKQLGIPLSSAHIAMTPNRLVVSAGVDSAQRASAQLAAPAPKSSPLFAMSFDLPRFQKLLASFGQTALDDYSYLRSSGMSLDVADDGLSFDIWGMWAESGPAAIAAPPAAH